MTARRTPRFSGLGEWLDEWVQSEIQGLLDGMSLIPAPVLPGSPGQPLMPPGLGTAWHVDYAEYDPSDPRACLTYFPLVGSETVFIVRPPAGTPVLVPGEGWDPDPSNRSVVLIESASAQEGDIVVVQYAHNFVPGTGVCGEVVVPPPTPPDCDVPPSLLTTDIVHSAFPGLPTTASRTMDNSVHLFDDDTYAWMRVPSEWRYDVNHGANSGYYPVSTGYTIEVGGVERQYSLPGPPDSFCTASWIFENELGSIVAAFVIGEYRWIYDVGASDAIYDPLPTSIHLVTIDRATGSVLTTNQQAITRPSWNNRLLVGYSQPDLWTRRTVEQQADGSVVFAVQSNAYFRDETTFEFEPYVHRFTLARGAPLPSEEVLFGFNAGTGYTDGPNPSDRFSQVHTMGVGRRYDTADPTGTPYPGGFWASGMVRLWDNKTGTPITTDITATPQAGTAMTAFDWYLSYPVEGRNAIALLLHTISGTNREQVEVLTFARCP